MSGREGDIQGMQGLPPYKNQVWTGDIKGLWSWMLFSLSKEVRMTLPWNHE